MSPPRPVLVIDDDRDIRETILEVLADEGVPAVGAASGRAALELLRSAREPPALILLDLMMPELSGAQFREAQLADPALAAIPVVILSAAHDAVAESVRLGAAGCLRKPLRLDQLVETARRFVGLPRPGRTVV